MDGADQGNINIIVEDENSPVSIGIEEFLEFFGGGGAESLWYWEIVVQECMSRKSYSWS
jgi:hypothetical protein